MRRLQQKRRGSADQLQLNSNSNNNSNSNSANGFMKKSSLLRRRSLEPQLDLARRRQQQKQQDDSRTTVITDDSPESIVVAAAADATGGAANAGSKHGGGRSFVKRFRHSIGGMMTATTSGGGGRVSGDDDKQKSSSSKAGGSNHDRPRSTSAGSGGNEAKNNKKNRMKRQQQQKKRNGGRKISPPAAVGTNNRYLPPPQQQKKKKKNKKREKKHTPTVKSNKVVPSMGNMNNKHDRRRTKKQQPQQQQQNGKKPSKNKSKGETVKDKNRRKKPQQQQRSSRGKTGTGRGEQMTKQSKQKRTLPAKNGINNTSWRDTVDDMDWSKDGQTFDGDDQNSYEGSYSDSDYSDSDYSGSYYSDSEYSDSDSRSFYSDGSSYYSSTSRSSRSSYSYSSRSPFYSDMESGSSYSRSSRSYSSRSRSSSYSRSSIRSGSSYTSRSRSSSSSTSKSFRKQLNRAPVSRRRQEPPSTLQPRQPPTSLSRTSKNHEKVHVEKMLAQLQKESMELESTSPPTMTYKDPEKAHVEMMLAQLRKESMELERADASQQVPHQQQNTADREAEKIQKMLATIQQETRMMEQKMDERRLGQQQQHPRDGDHSGKDYPSEASSWSASSDSYVSLEKHLHIAREEEKDFDSSYESFKQLSAAKRINAEEPAFKPMKKKGSADLVPTIKDKANDPEVRQQLELLAEKMKEIGINPEEIGISLNDTSDERKIEMGETLSVQRHQLPTRSQGDVVSSLPDVANQLAMAQQMCSSNVPERGHSEPSKDVPDAASQMAMGQRMVLAKLQADAKQPAVIESNQKSHRRTNSSDGIRSESGNLAAPSTDNNQESERDGRPLSRERERPKEGQWLYRQLSFESDRSNKSTPSTTINVGLFIDDSPSVRNILPITSVDMSDSFRRRPPRPVWDDDDASSSSYNSTSSSFSSSTSSSYFDTSLKPKTPVEGKGGMRPMRGNRISYKSLNDFIEEHTPDNNIASDKGSSKMGSSRGGKSVRSTRSFRSNRHSFKDLTDYDDECRKKEEVLSTTTDRKIYETFVEDGSTCSGLEKRTSDELLVMTPSRESYKILNLLIKEHIQVPAPQLDDDKVGLSQLDPKPLEPPVRSISVPSLEGKSFEDDDDISGLFPLTQGDVESKDSGSRTRRSVDPPETHVASRQSTQDISSSTRNQIDNGNIDPTLGENGAIQREPVNTSHVGSGSRHEAVDERAISDQIKSADDSSGGAVKKREKSRSRSPSRSFRHDSRERLKELSSRKEEKEKALRKLLEKSSAHSQHRRHSLDLPMPTKSFSNDNSSTEGRHQKFPASRSQEFVILPRKDRSRHNDHRKKVDKSQRDKSNRRGSPVRGNSKHKDESESNLNKSSSSHFDVKSSSKRKSRMDRDDSKSSIDIKSSSKHTSQRTPKNSRSSIEAHSSSNHGHDRSKEKKLKKTGHFFDLESLVPSKKKSSRDKEKKKGKSMKSKSTQERSSRHDRHRSKSREDKKDEKKKKKDKRKDKDKDEDDEYRKNKKKDKKKYKEKKSSYNSSSHHHNRHKGYHHSDIRHNERTKSSKLKSSRLSSSSQELNVDVVLEPFQRLRS